MVATLSNEITLSNFSVLNQCLMIWSVDSGTRRHRPRNPAVTAFRPALSGCLASARCRGAVWPRLTVKHFRPAGQDFLKCETAWQVCRNP